MMQLSEEQVRRIVTLHHKADEEKRQEYNKRNREMGGTLGPYAPPRQRNCIFLWTAMTADLNALLRDTPSGYIAGSSTTGAT